MYPPIWYTTSMDERIVHGYTVKFADERAHEGVRYIRDHLDEEEAKVFFHEAKERGSARFEDRDGHNYKMTYERDSMYFIERRHE